MRELTRWQTVAAAVMIVMTLGGCSGLKEGRTAPEATAALRSVEGVAAGDVELVHSQSGFTSRWNVSITFKPADDYDDIDKRIMFERILRIGWSVNEHKIDSGVSIVLDDSGRSIDLVQAAEDSGVAGVIRIGNLRSQFSVPSSVLQQEFGQWPGRKSDQHRNSLLNVGAATVAGRCAANRAGLLPRWLPERREEDARRSSGSA